MEETSNMRKADQPVDSSPSKRTKNPGSSRIIKNTCPSGFEVLFAKSVPHILENIFFSLDYKSFKTCREVCKAWNGLMTSCAYEKKCVEMLAEKKAIEEELLRASKLGNEEQVHSLLSRGADPNCIHTGGYYYHGGKLSFPGDTPLIMAAANGHHHVARALLNVGADANKAGCKGDTPLILAAQRNRKDVVNLLLNAGSDVNLRSDYRARSDGKTALIIAVEGRYHDMVRLLLDHGADPNLADKNGNAPLHHARISENPYSPSEDMLGLLISRGAVFFRVPIAREVDHVQNHTEN